MKTIPLTQGQFAIIDDEDYPRVSEYMWLAHRCRLGAGDIWYARRTFYKSTGIRKRQALHSFIMGTTKEIDHQNRNGLDCQKRNLRVATRSQNQMNKRTVAHSSRFKGVSWMKNEGFWVAWIHRNRKHYYLGIFRSETDAALAYDAAAIRLFGDFALTNKAMGLL